MDILVHMIDERSPKLKRFVCEQPIRRCHVIQTVLYSFAFGATKLKLQVSVLVAEVTPNELLYLLKVPFMFLILD